MSDAVAIVGLACRFPGARDLDEFWSNLCGGVESIRTFAEDELSAAGVDAAQLARADYVKAGAVLPEADRFDAAFFGYTPREAELIDPQQRIFLECAWSALEHAGWNPLALPGATGVFAGSGLNTYLLRQIAPNAAAVESAGGFSVMIANDKDFLPTRVAYKLNLRGPAVAVQTACSTSLVAVHLAAQSLLGGECDAAVAGGVSIRFPQTAGYVHQDGMILSPDGHCRAFDARAAGTVGGNGAGAVVLKRLADAVAAGDTIHAVILGSAVNNDGAGKVGYTAPSVEGQEAVIAEALAVAGAGPETIGYVEAHGTATSLGDPIEVAALTRAFRRGTDRRQFCALGSVKTNIGHLDAAAGVAGLIKAVLALKHGVIPASLHFTAPNPAIDFAGSPFRVAARLESWPRGETPRRAGVSSFGIGGTNAHVVLEEAPAVAPAAERGGPQLVVLSARTETALARATENLARNLEAHPDRSLADVAYTLAVGRREFACRRFVVARTAPEAAAILRGAGQEGQPTPLSETARSWASGGMVDWAALYAGQGRRRVPLPSYPFEGERHWIESEPPKKPDLADWFYFPGWRASPLPAILPPVTEGVWVVFSNGAGLGARLLDRLRAGGAVAIDVRRAGGFAATGPLSFVLGWEAGDFAALFSQLKAAGLKPRWLIDATGVDDGGAGALSAFYDLFALASVLGSAELDGGARLIVAASRLCALPGEGAISKAASLLLGPVRVLPRERPGITVRAMDVSWEEPGPASADDRVDALLTEARIDGSEVVVAWRGRRRWVQTADPVRVESASAKLRERGTYLVTGGLGGIGAVLAEDLARRCRARLVLTGRTALPARDGWAGWLATHGPDDAVGARIRRVQAIEAAGGEVLIACADAGDAEGMRSVVAAARARFGEIHGIIHAAGLPGGGAMAGLTRKEAKTVLAPKYFGVRVLDEIFRDAPLDFFALMSSLSAQLGEFGQAAYASANAYLDAFAQVRHAAGIPIVSIAWDAWRDTGMAARLSSTPGLAEWAASRRPFQITDEEGVEIFHRAVASGVPHVIISTHDLMKRGQAASCESRFTTGGLTPSVSKSPRPELPTGFVAPATETERRLAAVWEELIGVAPIGTQDDFFDLGGHSLLATQVIARVRGRDGAPLALPAFFDTPTIAALAEILDARGAFGADEPALAPAPRAGPLPLSYQQQALWLLDRMEGRSAQMNELGAQTIRGQLDAAALRHSLAEVARRHEALRTRFAEQAGEPSQVIMPELAVDLPLTDLSGQPVADRDEAVRRLAADLVARPFDLREGPLLRAALVRCGAGHHVMLVVVHHIVFDGWSSSVFFREMVAIYAALARGFPPLLPPLPVQYADYAIWQRAALRGARRERLASFWREQLAGRPSALALPTDHPRPPAQAFCGRKHRVELGAALTARLEEVGRGSGASLFMSVLAAYGALLGRYAGQDEVIVGCPAANRARREIEPLVGFFINPLPMRLDLRGDPSFAGLLARARRTVLAAYEHQEMPFELIVEAAQPRRDPSRHPIFQSMLVYQNAVPPAPAAPGLVVEPLEFPEGPARTDLDFYLWESAEGLRGYFIYDTALFAAPTIARLAERWRTLVESAVEHPALPLSELRLDRPVTLPQLPRAAPRRLAASGPAP